MVGSMGSLLTILRRARRSFRGRISLRLASVIAMAILTGAVAGLLPAVIGRAVGTLSGAPPGRASGGFARLVDLAMPSGSTWGVVLVTLLATIVTVGIGVLSSKLGTSLSGDVTAALRVEMMRAVLGASARDIEQVGEEITAGPRRPPGMGPVARGAPAAGAPPGGAPAGGRVGLEPGAGAKPASAKALRGSPRDTGATRTAVVKLAVSREAALVSDFGVSVMGSLPQSVATLAVLAVELVSSDAWIVLVGGVVLFVVSRLFADRASRRVGLARHELQTADAAVFGSLQETLAATEDLRLWGAREQAVREFAEVAQECAAARSRFATALAVAGQIKSVFTAMAPLLILVALKLAPSSGQSGAGHDAGEIAKLLLLVPLLMVRLEALDGVRQGLIERAPVLKATRRLLDLEEAPSRPSEPLDLDLASVAGRIRFRQVSYTPPGADRKVIDGVSLEIPAGAIVGICGPSGSGKSSLLRLLLRLDDPDEGEIFVDDVEIRQLDPQLLPRLFGVVRQTSQLLERPVRDNLALGLDPAPADERMRAALTAVKMHELAGQQGERDLGTAYRKNPPNFSGGEHRRLLMARMLVQDAPVCVLDEPEAGLPSGTAEDILETVVAGAGGRTHLVVTHAPHLLVSDFNVVLDAGRVVGQGKHAELVKSSAIYRELLADALQEGLGEAAAADPGST